MMDADEHYIFSCDKKDMRRIVSTYEKKFGRLGEKNCVVFDIDGTLLLGKIPNHTIVKYFWLLAERGAEIYIITARQECMRESTINQLAKHDIIEYKKLIMMPDGHTDQEQFKESARAQLGQIDLCIGDRWGDIDADQPTIEHMCDTYGGGVNIVAKKFIKLAEQ